MNIIYNGSIKRDGIIYDYSAVWTRRSGGIDWKAIVRGADVLCRPSGVLDDVLTDGQVRQVITQLVSDSIESLVSERPAKRNVVSLRSGAVEPVRLPAPSAAALPRSP
jgi:hypothetical protein